MTAYGGGKARLGKQIYKAIKEIQEKMNWYSDTYIEPFCGMLGVAKYFISFPGEKLAKKESPECLKKKSVSSKRRSRARRISSMTDYKKIILSDANKDIILMWKKLKRGGWTLPRTCGREKYEDLKASKKHSADRGFYGVSCAYSGIFFAGYRPKSKRQNFFKKSRENISETGKLLKLNSRRIKLTCSSYRDFKPKGMTIYCDPPYEDNKFNIKHFNDFDSKLFWDTMRKWSKDNLVIISEYKAPKDFKCVWKKDTKSVFSGKSKTRVEKLFMYLPDLPDKPRKSIKKI